MIVDRTILGLRHEVPGGGSVPVGEAVLKSMFEGSLYMPKREDDIRIEIERMDGLHLERFARELLSRELYPNLNPTSPTHDLGEDARTEPTTFVSNGKKISLAISKDDTWAKVKEDCDRCVETYREIDIFVFVTSGNPRTDIVERWKKDVKATYGWDLEVRSLDFLAPYASRPQYESLVDDYLHIPPPGGDYINDIEKKISNITQRYLSQIDMTIPGMSTPLSREEVNIKRYHGLIESAL